MKDIYSDELKRHLAEITDCLRMDAAGKIKIGYHLWFIKNHKEELGWSNFENLVKEELGITRQTATTYMRLCNEYCIKDADGNPTDQINEEEITGMKLKQLVSRLNLQLEDPASTGVEETIPSDDIKETAEVSRTEGTEESQTTSLEEDESSKKDLRSFYSWSSLADFCSTVSEPLAEGYHIEVCQVRDKK